MKKNQVDSDDHSSQMLSTAFNCLRAVLAVLTKDLVYLTEEQARLVDQLIDNQDVYVGAVYEVFLENEDLEDLTHSLLSLLHRGREKEPGRPAPVTAANQFAYRAKEQAMMLHILKRVKEHNPKFSAEEVFSALTCERSIISLYRSTVGTKKDENQMNMTELCRLLTTRADSAKKSPLC